ncbi:MAG: hypothetical protein AB1Z67_05100 [Candidatus Limnocylindrales bacterium]
MYEAQTRLVAAFGTALALVVGSATIEDIQTSTQAVQAAFQALETAAGDLAESQVQAIEDATDELRSAIDAIPDTDTVDQALASLTPQVAALRAAINDAGETNCARVLIEAQAEQAAQEAQEAEATMEADAEEAASEAEADVEAAFDEAGAEAEDAASDVEATMEAAVDEAEAEAEDAEEAMESMAPEVGTDG